jgi:hypothetical protein
MTDEELKAIETRAALVPTARTVATVDDLPALIAEVRQVRADRMTLCSLIDARASSHVLQDFVRRLRERDGGK